MKRALIATLALSLVVLSAVAIHASIRVNGNQLLEAGFDSGSIRKAKGASESGTSIAAPRLIYQVGLGVIADGRLPDSSSSGDSTVAFRIGIGLSYDIATVVYNVFCPIQMTGDMDVSQTIQALDIMALVNFVFRDGPFPQPCRASGDVNCSGEVNATDVIYLVDYVFRGGAEPCDVCNLIPGTWTCP